MIDPQAKPAAYIKLILLVAVLGLAANVMFPAIPVAVAVAATMAGVLVAVVASALLTAFIALRAARRATAQPQPYPATT